MKKPGKFFLTISFIIALAGCGGGGGTGGAIPRTLPAPANSPIYTTLRSVEIHPWYGDPTAQISQAIAMNANAVRVDYTKEFSEGYYDQLFGAAVANHISGVAIISPYIHTNNTFAEGIPYTPAAYADYVAAEVKRRCGSVPSLIVEIYNEPDVANGQANIGYVTYLPLAKATALAVRAGCQSAKIITGGTSGLNLGWDQAIASLAPYVDGYGLHPYGLADGDMRAAITAVQAAFGIPKPVYFSEFYPETAAFKNADGYSPFWNAYQDNLIDSLFKYPPGP